MAAASALTCSGRKVSTMTASSFVRVAPIDSSALPGWGPCGRPCGCNVIEPLPMPLRLMELVVRVVEHLVRHDVRMVVRRGYSLGIEVEGTRAERAEDQSLGLEGL